MNMATISVLMIISFATIYTITYNNIQKDINIRLNRPDYVNKNKFNQHEFMDRPDGADDFSPMFTIRVDNSTQNVTVVSNYKYGEDVYVDIANMIIENDADSNYLKYESTYFYYKIFDYPDASYINILDGTREHEILISLIWTLIMVFVVSEITVYLISLYFANKSVEPIEESWNKQNQFILDASHELKTPLAVISTNIDVVRANEDETVKTQMKWLDYVQEEIVRMSNLTSNLLYLAKDDNVQQEIMLSTFDVSNMLQNIELSMESLAFERGITFDADIENDVLAYANKEQIQQVIMILIDNAFKYVNPNGEIHIQLKQKNDKVNVRVINSGDGIDSDEIDKIFDRFYRVDKSRNKKTGGHGLGLAIAQKIVTDNNGSIKVSSVVGESTTFEIFIPVGK